MTEAELNALAEQAKARTRAKGREHFHRHLHALQPIGEALGYAWEPYFGKRPCEVCNAWPAGDRVLTYAYTRDDQGQVARLSAGPHTWDARELAVCLDCLSAWQEV